MMVLSFRPSVSRQGFASVSHQGFASRMLIIGLVMAGLMAWSSSKANAQTQNTQALLDRVNRLERDIRTLNQQIAKGNGLPFAPAPSTAVPMGQDALATDVTKTAVKSFPTPKFAPNESTASRLTVRIDALEQELRHATGLSESIAHSVDLVGVRLDKLIVDLDYRLSTLEGTTPGTNSMAKPMAEAPSGGLTPNVSLPPTPGNVSREGALAPVGTMPDAQMPTSPAPYLKPKPAGSSSTLGVVPQSNLDQIVSNHPKGIDENAGAKDVVDATKPVPGKVANALPQTPSTVGAQAQSVAKPAPAPEKKVNVADQYKAAFNLTRQARYSEAEIAFKAFIEANGNDPLVGNARYWLGETHYVRKDFMQSAQAFFQAYQQFPKGPKAPDSLLKLGMSMAGLEKTSEACATFGKLKKEFGTDLKPNIERALNKETKRLACK